jgi:hypothetical protein
MAFLFVLTAAATAFFLLGYALEALGLLDDPPCDCEACAYARRSRDRSRAY